MRVSIEQDECTGCGACPDYANVFFMGDDGLAYVKESDQPEAVAVGDLRFRTLLQTVVVPSGLEEEVIEAVEHCPGGTDGCIYLFADDEVDADGNVQSIASPA